MASSTPTSRSAPPAARRIAIALACLGVVGAAWWIRADRRAHVPPLTTVDALAPAQVAAPARPAVVPSTSAPAHPSSAATASATTSLAEQVDRWSHSSETRDAMRAYAAVSTCLLARRREHLPSERFDGVPGADVTALQACADLRSDQVQDRLRWLERAARAGEPGAAG